MSSLLKKAKILLLVLRIWRKWETMDKSIWKTKTVWAGIIGGLAVIFPALACLFDGGCTFGDIAPKLMEGLALVLGAVGIRFAIANNGNGK